MLEVPTHLYRVVLYVITTSPPVSELRIQAPGSDLDADRYIRSCLVMFGNWVFLVSLVLLSVKGFDVVLRMD